MIQSTENCGRHDFQTKRHVAVFFSVPAAGFKPFKDPGPIFEMIDISAPTPTYWCLLGNGWEWGLVGRLLLVIMDHSLIPISASTRRIFLNI